MTKMLLKFLIISLIVLTKISSYAGDQAFRLHLSAEPTTLDPQKQKTANSSYLIHNLHRSLYSFDDTLGLQYELAQSCVRADFKLTCKLKPKIQWSNGSPITADDFVRSFQFLIDPKNAAPKADFIFSLKNAKEIYNSTMPPNKLGITSEGKNTIVFLFQENDFDFEYKLTSSLLSPRSTSPNLTSGPYKIVKNSPGESILLEPHLSYPLGNPQRPNVQFRFIEEDSVALKLFKNNELDFLRRLPTLLINSYKNTSEFHFIPVLRFDYFGFSELLKDKSHLRTALATSLDYVELQSIFHSIGRPGCVGIPNSMFNSEISFNACHNFNIAKSQKELENAPPPLPSLELVFSSLGGDDHKRTSEWIQNQWLKNLNIKVKVRSLENKIFLQTLANKPPTIFRKGISLDRPTCLAALENFLNIEENENPVKIKSDTFTKIILEMRNTQTSKYLKDLCTQGLKILINEFHIIPTGPIHFAILAKPSFSLWKLNSLNQLDLSYLKKSKP